MTPSIKTLALALSIPLALAGNASAATALIDFGRTANTTAGYNNVGATTPVALVDTGAAATGWTVTMANTGNGGFGQAGAGADVPTFPAAVSAFATTALQDSLFANAGNPVGTASMTVTLSGLSPLSVFDLLFYGSRSNLQNISQTWTLTQGMSATPVNHDSLLNSTVAVDWKNVAPTAGGVIQITLSGPPTTAGALALNFGSITEVVPEPSAVFLLGLSGLALLARRRR